MITKGPLILKIILLCIFSFISIAYAQDIIDVIGKENLVTESADKIQTRFAPPAGYQRESYAKNSFATFLRELKLKDLGSPVLYHDGSKKSTTHHASVIEMDILPQDLIQCADAVIKLRAEYLYKEKKYNKISFELTNGMKVPFSKFTNGERVKVTGNKTIWVRGKYKSGYGRDVFNEYLKFIYIYAGTLSLSNQMSTANIKDIKIGDVFLQGGSPGHALIVADLAINQDTGEKVMMLVQSYMPSQELHVLKSYSPISPWYQISDTALITPEWIFKKGSLRKW